MTRRCLLLLPLLALIAGCPRAAAPKVAVAPPKANAAVMHQGLTGAERADFYHLTMGSELVPLAWLKALQSDATGKPFLDNMERFGLVPDPTHADGLPIGFSAAESKDPRFPVKMVGLNCAACHTGEMTYKGQTLRVDGGSSLFDAEAFTKDLLTSLVATVKSPSKLLAFLRAQLDDDLARKRPAAHRFLSRSSSLDALKGKGHLEKKLATHLEIIVQAEWQRPGPPLEAGLDFDKDKARPDDLVGPIEHAGLTELAALDVDLTGPLAHLKSKDERQAALKEILDHLVIHLRLLKARIDFAKKTMAESTLKLANTSGGPGRVDDFGAARNLLFDAKDAQAMNAPCSIPHLWGTAKLAWTNWDGSTQATLERSVATALAGGAVFDPKSYRSTVHLRHLGTLEALAGKIAPPAWPEDLFGKIDRAKAERGAALFNEHCARCHADHADKITDLNEIGTDATRVRNYARPLGERNFGAAVQAETGKYVTQSAKDAAVNAEELDRYRGGHPNVWRTTPGYAARQLVAVWASPPYLHNGSVPTIDDLLKPAKDRPKSFPLGHREYDPARLGFITSVEKAVFTFDTTLPGNANTGHEFGVHLTAEQRQELIEYLKAN